MNLEMAEQLSEKKDRTTKRKNITVGSPRGVEEKASEPIGNTKDRTRWKSMITNTIQHGQ